MIAGPTAGFCQTNQIGRRMAAARDGNVRCTDRSADHGKRSRIQPGGRIQPSGWSCPQFGKAWLNGPLVVIADISPVHKLIKVQRHIRVLNGTSTVVGLQAGFGRVGHGGTFVNQHMVPWLIAVRLRLVRHVPRRIRTTVVICFDNDTAVMIAAMSDQLPDLKSRKIFGERLIKVGVNGNHRLLLHKVHVPRRLDPGRRRNGCDRRLHSRSPTASIVAVPPPPINQFTNGYTDREIILGDRTICLRVPDDPDRVLEQATEDGGHDPYWSILWSAAEPTAEFVLRHQWRGDETAIELGCGMGLTGLAALSCGLHVTFTDIVPTAVELALHNARRNGYSGFAGSVLDWNAADEFTAAHGPFDVVLASDVLYDRTCHDDFLTLVTRLLQPRGVCLVGDPCRHAADHFVARARQLGWNVQLTEQQQRNFRCLIMTNDRHGPESIASDGRPND